MAQRRGTWWWTTAVILVPVVGTAVVVGLLLAFVDVSSVQDQIELLKTGFTIGAGSRAGQKLKIASSPLCGRPTIKVRRAIMVT